MNSNEMIVIDLPSLQSITLGHATIDGNDDNFKCILVMRSMKVIMRNDGM